MIEQPDGNIPDIGSRTRNKRWRTLLKGKDVGEIMMAEIDLFPLNGWKIWIQRRTVRLSAMP